MEVNIQRITGVAHCANVVWPDLEHNFGHGQQYLSAFMLSLNLLAFLFHTVLEWSDAKSRCYARCLPDARRFSMISRP